MILTKNIRRREFEYCVIYFTILLKHEIRASISIWILHCQQATKEMWIAIANGFSFYRLKAKLWLSSLLATAQSYFMRMRRFFWIWWRCSDPKKNICFFVAIQSLKKYSNETNFNGNYSVAVQPLNRKHCRYYIKKIKNIKNMSNTSGYSSSECSICSTWKKVNKWRIKKWNFKFCSS